jgi:hypothetical protein
MVILYFSVTYYLRRTDTTYYPICSWIQGSQLKSSKMAGIKKQKQFRPLQCAVHSGLLPARFRWEEMDLQTLQNNEKYSWRVVFQQKPFAAETNYLDRLLLGLWHDTSIY